MSSRPARPTKGRSARSQEAARLAAEQAARRRHDRRVLVAVLVALVVLVVGGGTALQAWRTQRLPAAAVPSGTVGDTPQPVADGQPIRLGRAEAPVVVQLYEDFHCPHCVDFADELGPTLAAAQEAGTVQVELYPMAFVDEGSAPAANAMACAAEAGFASRYYTGLFANATLQWSDRQLVDLAAKVGASPDDTFARCVTTDAKAGWVDSIDAAAGRNSVTQTPTLFLDGAPVDIASLTPESLQSMIDAKR